MKDPLLVVDGSNVLGSRPSWKWWRDRRGASLRLLRELQSWGREDILLVLDGHESSEFPSGWHDGVEVRFANCPGRDGADDVIAQVVPQDARGWRVVTADRGLKSRLQGRGCELVGPKWLWREMDRSSSGRVYG